jgi:hypothetical protein
MYTYILLNHHFNWENKLIKSGKQGAYYALKEHIAQAKGDNLD